jgi:hypothetical protein
MARGSPPVAAAPARHEEPTVADPGATSAGQPGTVARQKPAEDPGASLLEKVRGVVGSLSASAAALVGIGGGLIYAWIARGYQTFYGNFGITPSDVGITQSDIVTDTAVGLVAVGLATFFLWLCFYAVVVLLFKRPRLKSKRGIFAVLLYTLIGYELLALIFPVLRLQPFAIYSTLFWILFITILTVLVTQQSGSWPQEAVRNLCWFLAAGSVLLFVLSSTFATQQAGELSTLISDGYVLPEYAPIFLVDIRADPVCVKGLPHSPRSGSRPVYYLGRSGDLIVLYDPEVKKTIIRPVAGIELAFIPRSEWPSLSIAQFSGICSRA